MKLLVALKGKVQSTSRLEATSCYLYCDSKVVLSWINTEPSLLQQYVANRVVKILESSATMDWRYINTKHNPADVASRGMQAKELIKCTL